MPLLPAKSARRNRHLASPGDTTEQLSPVPVGPKEIWPNAVEIAWPSPGLSWIVCGLGMSHGNCCLNLHQPDLRPWLGKRPLHRYVGPLHQSGSLDRCKPVPSGYVLRKSRSPEMPGDSKGHPWKDEPALLARLTWPASGTHPRGPFPQLTIQKLPLQVGLWSCGSFGCLLKQG